MLLSDPALALLALHRGAGLRVALRASIAGVCILVFTLGSAPDLAYTVYRFVLGVVSTEAGPGSLQILGLVGLGLAARGEARVRTGVRDWLLTLPASGADHRRALWSALVLAQLPVLAAGGVCALATLLGYREPLAPAKLAGLPLMVAGAAAAATPSARGWIARPLGLGAALLASLGAWWGVAGAVTALLAADRIAGPVRLPRARPRRPVLPVGTGLLLAWRALGPRLVLDALPALLPLAGAYFFRANNELAPASEAAAARVGGGIAAAAYVAALAGSLLRRRYPWAWVRSLPWSSLRRVGTDAGALALPGAWTLAAVAWLDPAAVPVAAVSLALSACVAAGAVRAAAERKTGAAGETAVVGVPAAVLLGLYPATWPLGLAMAAAALAVGRRRERAQRPTRWTELHHSAAGDSAWQGAP